MVTAKTLLLVNGSTMAQKSCTFAQWSGCWDNRAKKKGILHGHVSLRDGKTHGSVSKPCTPGEHQNSWKWMFIPPKMVLIGIDPFPFKLPANKPWFGIQLIDDSSTRHQACDHWWWGPTHN
jgi:hypothetical protein